MLEEAVWVIVWPEDGVSLGVGELESVGVVDWLEEGVPLGVGEFEGLLGVGELEGVRVAIWLEEGVTLEEGVLEGVWLGVATIRDAGRQGRAMPERELAGTKLWPKFAYDGGAPLSSVRPAPQQVAPPDAERVQVWLLPAAMATW